jgi:predicted ester cyclase
VGAEDNKELVRRVHAELVEARDPARIDEFFAPAFVSHNMPPGWPNGVDGVRRFMAMFGEALPDLTVTIDALLAEGDLVAVRTTSRGSFRGELLGIPPTGSEIAVDGTDIVRVEDGRIIEHWGLTNTVGLLQQVGRRARLRWLLELVLGRR